MLHNGVLEPYIKYIRFPFYKNLEEGARIDFDFPITVLIGQNGTNKSSVLRAVFGCPEDCNVGNFWFSTAVDPIHIQDRKSRPPRFIYGYFHKIQNRTVEVIKTRIEKKRVVKGKSYPNPDYWEPSRPLKSDGMELMPETNLSDKDDLLKKEGRLKTRWPLIDKNVVFKDFRSEISAFDKYFYHGNLTKTLKYNTKQDFIRDRSKQLRKVIRDNLKSLKLFRGKKEHVYQNYVLPDDQVKAISDILGKRYSGVRVIQHKLFKVEGDTVILETEDLRYSEAFAGSGEFAIAQIVKDVMSAPERSLIIFDEPEVSLHPGAQERLMRFLKDQVKWGRHQVVIG